MFTDFAKDALIEPDFGRHYAEKIGFWEAVQRVPPGSIVQFDGAQYKVVDDGTCLARHP